MEDQLGSVLSLVCLSLVFEQTCRLGWEFLPQEWQALNQEPGLDCLGRLVVAGWTLGPPGLARELEGLAHALVQVAPWTPSLTRA